MSPLNGAAVECAVRVLCVGWYSSELLAMVSLVFSFVGIRAHHDQRAFRHGIDE